MGEKYTVIARDYEDEAWMDYAATDNLLRAIIVLIQAAVKYELVEFSIRK
jgi:hypothetical protein